MSKHAVKHFARQQRRYALRDADEGHHLGHKREDTPVQAWSKHAARLSWHRFKKPIPQTAPVISYPNGVPME